jgi:malonyl-CoA O-methyltransferase
MVHKPSISDNFSRYAHLYDKYASVQMKAALKLTDSIKSRNFSKVLEIGCGTGNYTLMLRNRFKQARIKALDISDKMIGLARDKLKNNHVEFIVADAEDIVLNEDFDLITSNACFQWFENLGAVMRKYEKSLQKRGVICFSIFGPHTFDELNTALICILKEERIHSTNFYNKENLETILKHNFNSVKINEISYRENFVSLKELLEKIKFSGIRGNGLSHKVNFNRRLLGELEKAYLDRFKEIRATYQIFICQGEKR